MKMSDVERLTLIRLHEILAVLKPKEAKDHQVAIHILQEGYHEDLYEQTSASYLSDPFPELEQNRVYDILNLYAKLNRSYETLSKSDRKKIDKSSLRFPGFDGSSESAHAAFGRFIVKKQHRWSELEAKSDFETTKPMLPIYDAMLRASRKMTKDEGQFTAADIVHLLELAQPAEST